MNMFLHNIEFDKFNIEYDDTLLKPIINTSSRSGHFQPPNRSGDLRSPSNIDDLIFNPPFQAIVTNPPYSIKWDGDANPLLIHDPRYSPAGVLAPKAKADMAFILHCLAFLAPEGTSAIVCFPGILYRGGAEQKIRQYLIDNNFVVCIIQLPDKLFYGTSIATCIMVLKKNKKENKTLFIDASQEFVKVTNSNKLTDENINKILGAYAGCCADFQSANQKPNGVRHYERVDIPHFCRYVHNDVVANENYNLSVSTYVEKEDKREVVDIAVLNAEIKEIVARQSKLREELDGKIKEIEK
jgi:type I restriction enzyme M protein